ncbi:cytochrome c family protein [Shimia sp. R11_0]|uniref:Cytochrome c550 n=1 Tax=Shimia marina TaxID=321267 RepID=A0A0P1EKV7_9RHOB|nr:MULTISPECIES: cytochrome c family protein [Shimia]MBO9476773.1 cytochrome c family protein [Shimia sp. R11_0]CUH50922.1 Cytochrome c550 [Shimia marina]SFE56964.1 cytochrome c [Shimia marina]
MHKTAMVALVLTLGGGMAFAEGDAKAGKKVFKKCKACHSLKEGQNKVGPTLYGVLGAEAGAVEGFRYSSALQEAGIVWDDEALSAFLSKPKAFVPGTSMAFPGLKKQDQIDDLLAYLQSEQSEQ